MANFGTVGMDGSNGLIGTECALTDWSALVNA